MNNNAIDILFILVLYRCEIDKSTTFVSITNSLKNNNYSADWLIYDNSPEFNLNIDPKKSSNINMIYLPDKENSGVSKAYNTGAAIAKKMNKKWILFLDQDTNFPPDTVQKYLSGINKYPGIQLIAPIILSNENAIISPSYFKFMRGFKQQHCATGLNSLRNLSLINCGTCVNVAAFEKNGGYNELIKLDFSDHDFIKRFKIAVSDAFVVIDLKVYHQLSTEAKNSLRSDAGRFSYYLTGAKHIKSSVVEKLFLRFNAAARAVKLSLIHRNVSFIFQLIKWI